MAPTRSTDSALSVAEGSPTDRFALAGLSSVEVRFSSLRTGVSSGAGTDGLVSAAAGFSSAPTLVDGPATSPRDVFEII